jgi:flagellar motility protein MotE (MotC chaperone)
MLNLCTYIQETVSRNYLPYTFKKETAYKMLVSLKNHVAPTHQARKMELIHRYQRMKKAPKAQQLEAWLQD